MGSALPAKFDRHRYVYLPAEDSIAHQPAHIIGWSDGGIIGLFLAIQRPDLVKSLVAIGANYHFKGTVDSFEMGPISDEDRAEYAIYSPDTPETMDRIYEPDT